MSMENNNYKKSSNLIIRSVIDGWQTMIVFLFVGIAEAIAMGVIGLPIMLIMNAMKASLVLQWGVLYVIMFIIFSVFSFVGWTQSKFIGIFMTIMNIALFVLVIMSNK